jgi:YfiH family protein
VSVDTAFTDRRGGHSQPPFDSLNLGGFNEDDTGAIRANYQVVAARTGCDRIAICSQVHGTQVEVVDDEFPLVDPKIPAWPALRQADALVTGRPGIALVIRVADCVPVLLADARAGVVAAAHAGRVGLLAGVLQATVETMRECGARTIQAWVGPHICAACYEVPQDMAEAAWQQLPASRARSRQGSPAIDLGAGAAAVLTEQQVSVQRCDPCTACQPDFFSYRRDQGRTGRQAGVIWLA